MHKSHAPLCIRLQILLLAYLRDNLNLGPAQPVQCKWGEGIVARKNTDDFSINFGCIFIYFKAFIRAINLFEGFEPVKHPPKCTHVGTLSGLSLIQMGSRFVNFTR